jgi:hypothetical protein
MANPADFARTGLPRALVAASESLIHVLGVVYVHRKTADGGDIYLTRFGLPVAEMLELDNWAEKEWFVAKRERLEGTSTVYRVPTKRIDGRALELVVKNCRVGEDVPLETRTLEAFVNAEFNSPWEEFALVMEMRAGKYGPPRRHIRTQEPLAIYVPPERMQKWQTGRSQSKISRIRARHPGIDLDILRQYKLIYGWIKGTDVVNACREIGLRDQRLVAALNPINQRAIQDMADKGYGVADMKPSHIILGETEMLEIQLLHGPDAERRREARVAKINDCIETGRYSIIDYELLVRTPDHDRHIKSMRRHCYLDDQRDRFAAAALPSHLTATEIMGVPYVFGHTESTNGRLWVVGCNGRLFDYFLPERWRKTHAWKLSESSEIYYTVTKDNVHLVWKESRVGETPAVDPANPLADRIRERGYNSPFEEFAIAHALATRGVPVIYVRAIYMTGSPKIEQATDPRRFASHAHLRDEDGLALLHEDHNFITLRGYYNGPDDWVAHQSGALCRPLDLHHARVRGIIDESTCRTLVDRVQSQLRCVGYDGSLLERNDLLMTLDPAGAPVMDGEGRPEVRICNFERIGEI